MDLPQIVKNKLLSLGADLSDSFLVAVSGGADSTALLLALRASLEQMDNITVAHLDHGVRSGSKRDMERVVQLCSELGVKVVTGQLDPEELDTRHRAYGSLEAGMRDLRYRFLSQAAGDTGSKWILTGHTADDQAETVLFRICRGMDWRSFSGIRGRRGNILRPLIEVSRTAAQTYCKALGVRTVNDHSNYDDSYQRNRIRNTVLPALEVNFAPGISDLLRRVGRAAYGLTTVQEKMLGQCLNESSRELTETLSRQTLLALPGVLRERMIVDHLVRILGEYPSSNLAEDALKFILAGRNGQLSLPGNMVLTLSYGQAAIAGKTGCREDILPAAALKFKVPGSLTIPSAGIIITAEECTLKDPGNYPAGQAVLLARKSVTGSLWVRRRLSGDLFIPLGMKGHRKLKDFLIDRKVSRAVRDCVPVVLNDAGDILWVGGIEISQLAALDGVRDEEAIMIRIEELSDSEGAPGIGSDGKTS